MGIPRNLNGNSGIPTTIPLSDGSDTPKNDVQRQIKEQDKSSSDSVSRPKKDSSDSKRQYTPEQIEYIKKERLRRKKEAEKNEKIIQQKQAKDNEERLKRQQQESSARKARRQPEQNQDSHRNNNVFTDDNHSNDEYAIDPVTGVKYKKLPAASKDVIRADKKSGGLGIEQLRNMIPEADFDLNDLDGAANSFLAHLRVPPDKEEMKRLREEKIARAKAQNDEYKQKETELEEKYGSLEADPDEVWNG